MDRFVKILRDNNMKVTPQRLAILNFLDNNKNHPTADQIYKKLKKKNPSLSKTTVYNSLDTLTQNKIIKSLTICNSENRYDIERGMHHHFLCTKCGRIYDIEFKCPNIKKIRAEIESCGHNIDEVHGYFRGLCKSCIEKEKK